MLTTSPDSPLMSSKRLSEIEKAGQVAATRRVELDGGFWNGCGSGDKEERISSQWLP